MSEQDIKTELTILASWARDCKTDEVTRENIDRIEKRIRDHLTETEKWPTLKIGLRGKLKALATELNDLVAELE